MMDNLENQMAEITDEDGESVIRMSHSFAGLVQRAQRAETLLKNTEIQLGIARVQLNEAEGLLWQASTHISSDYTLRGAIDTFLAGEKPQP